MSRLPDALCTFSAPLRRSTVMEAESVSTISESPRRSVRTPSAASSQPVTVMLGRSESVSVGATVTRASASPQNRTRIVPASTGNRRPPSTCSTACPSACGGAGSSIMPSPPVSEAGCEPAQADSSNAERMKTEAQRMGAG